MTCEWLTDRFGGFSGIGQSIALATLRSELNGVYESVILHPWNKDLSAIVTPCVNLNTFSQFNSNSRSWMTRCLHLTLFWGFCLGFALGFPSLDCPESSSSRWCEVHSNQQKWPQMVSSSPRVDGWTVGKFALSTQKGLQGPDAICGQDVGGTQWWTRTPSWLQCLLRLTYYRYFQAPKKLLALSWLPYNGRIMWQLGVPIWETQTAASSSDDIIIR